MNAHSQDTLSISEQETKNYAARIVAELERESQIDGKPAVIFLRGDLGVGKTIFTKGIAHAMGISDTVTSPTFILQQEYDGGRGYYTTLYHFDLYRLDEEKEIEYLNIPVLLQPHVILVIEWSEKSEKLFDQLSQKAHVRVIQLEHISPTERRITTL